MLKPGDVVGPYEIRGFLGQGGMGQVYRAFDPRLERTVALKVIARPASPAADPTSPEPERGAVSAPSDHAARLLREARAVASLSHPNVVAIYDVGESNGQLYLAMEYVVGSTLRRLVGAESTPLGQKLRWLVDVARALDAAHKKGLVHRDIKPENVMVREDGAVKVLDFGIARRTVAPGGEDQREIDTVTGGGAIAGTPVYMAPEQIKGAEVDARCDQFSWGVMAYELLSGERPWPDTGDVLQLVARVLTDPVPPLRAREPLPRGVEETVLRALSKDPEARFASMADVTSALEPLASPASAQVTSTGDRVRIAPPSGEGDGSPSPRDDPAAFAATTRVPTSISLEKPDAPEAEPPKAKTSWRRKRAVQLAVPLLLLLGLAGAVIGVRRRLGRPHPRSAARPLSTVPEAEAAYKSAMLLWHDGSVAKARASLRRATDLDPTFAAAHLELALETAQQNPTRAQQAFQAAFENRHMLVPRDAVLLEASEPYVRPKPDLGEWETRMTSAVFQFPRDPELQYYLGLSRERQGADEVAHAAFAAAVRLDPSFVPGLAALAGTERNLGRPSEALATTQQCLDRSPVASSCVELRYRLFSEMGACHRAREEAERWRTLEPTSPRAFAALSRALFGDGAARPSVEEALARRWSFLPEETRRRGELWDRMVLAIVDGDLAGSAKLAGEYEAALAPSADRFDHAMPTRVRINVLTEMDRLPDAAKVARAYLDRMDAWQPYPFAPDASVGFYEPLYRTGAIDKARLEAEWASWTAREKRRGKIRDERAAPTDWARWSSLWGSFAETKAEAEDALAHAPESKDLPVGSRRPPSLDFALGKVYALAGRPDEAMPHLLRVTGTCSSFDDTLLVLRARYYLGLAFEAKHDLQHAREAYARVTSTWPDKETSSRTVRLAKGRLAKLGR